MVVSAAFHLSIILNRRFWSIKIDTQLLNQKTQELENCEEKIREALKTADEALKECELKISDVNLSPLEKDNMIKPLGGYV